MVAVLCIWGGCLNMRMVWVSYEHGLCVLSTWGGCLMNVGSVSYEHGVGVL